VAAGSAGDDAPATPPGEGASGWRERLLGNRHRRGASVVELLRFAALVQKVQGSLEFTVGAFGLLVVIFAPDPRGSVGMIESGHVLHAACSAVALSAGTARLVAAARYDDFRGRALSFVAGVAGLFAFTCLCTPTALVVLVILLSVHRDGQVREAFDRRAHGATRREVERWLHRPEDPRRPS